MRVQGDSLVPAMPEVHGLPEQTYTIALSRKDPSRVFIGHSDGLASMRWNGHTWIDEGRLPHVIYEARSLAEDGEGAVWAGGGDGKVVRVDVSPTGMRDSKYQLLGAEQGLPDNSTDVQYVAGSLFVTLDRTKDIYRWDSAQKKFGIDNRFLLPVDSPDATPYLFPDRDGNFWSHTFSYDSRRLALFHRQPDGSWHAEEDAYRRLVRFHLLFFHSEPDGNVWAVGENIVPAYAGCSPGLPAIPDPGAAGQCRSKDCFWRRRFPGARSFDCPRAAARWLSVCLPSYGNSAAHQYQYMLEGADKDWSAWGTQREANYSGLGPGRLSVPRARAERRWPNRRRGDYAFIILPPWYRTTLAYCVYVLLFLLLALPAGC